MRLQVADRAVAGAGAAAQAAAFEGRTGGGGAGGQFAAVLQHDFAVGADVHQQAGRGIKDHAGGEHAGGDVRADVGRDAGQQLQRGFRRKPVRN